jgi:hypothetical protein
MASAEASKPEAAGPKTDPELAADAGLALFNKRKAVEEAERQRRVASGKTIYRN